MIDSPRTISHIYLFDLNGVLVKSIADPSKQISLYDLPKGTYLMKINAENSCFSTKVIRN